MIRITIPIAPRTKKNAQRIVYAHGHYMIMPSKQYKDYEKSCAKFMPSADAISTPVNIKCLYYTDTHRRVDLTNLLEATDDILVKYGVLEDDNSNIIVSHDGSRVFYDKANPRTEIEIEEVEA